jgi:5S rRNA maturation endonuclease (ribonuclease M5)
MKPSPKVPLDLLSQFADYCNSITEQTVIVVEGKRDIEALELIGIELTNGTILAKKGHSLSTFVNLIYQTPVIILLPDFDKEGKILRGKLLKELQKYKGHGFIDSFPRQLLFKFCRATRINEIEELKQFFK